MARILATDAQAWAEPAKLTIAPLDTELLSQVEEEIITKIAVVVDTSTWTNDTNTPKIVKTAIAKLYVSLIYDRQYSEDIADGSSWAIRLAANADSIVSGIVDGTIVIPGVANDAGEPGFYPTDISSAQEPTMSDPSLGPAAFSMGMVF